MMYLDTNVIVALINPEDPLHNRASGILRRHNEMERMVSQLVVTELYSVYSRVMGAKDVELEALVEYSLRRVGAKVLTEDHGLAHSIARRYSGQLRLRTLNLLHVATAKALGAEYIATLDQEILRRSNIISRILGLRVIGE